MDRDYEKYKQNFYEELEREKAQKSQSQYSLGSSSSSVGNVQLTSEERSDEQNEILDNNIIDDSVTDNPHNYYNYYELYKTIVNNRRTRNREQKGMYFKFYAGTPSNCGLEFYRNHHFECDARRMLAQRRELQPCFESRW